MAARPITQNMEDSEYYVWFNKTASLGSRSVQVFDGLTLPLYLFVDERKDKTESEL